MFVRVAILVALLVILGVPLGARLLSPKPTVPRGVRTLVVATPHVPQIRSEFGAAFERWHERVYHEPVRVDWRAPGQGTTEILKLLEAQYHAAAGVFDFADPKDPKAKPGTVSFDVLFGGGSFDHGRLRSGVQVEVGNVKHTLPMSVPAGFTQTQLDGWFGENSIGIQKLYDPDQFWIGTALSGFGIVYNKAVCKELGVPNPTTFEELAHPEFFGLLILAEPRQSGSVTTTMEAILNAGLWNTAREEGWEQELEAAFQAESNDKQPWEEHLPRALHEGVERGFARGWKLLRRIMCNARSITAAATRPPIDVSAGEGAAGLSIDFYGRGQAQAVLAQGQDPSTARVGYSDPIGSAYIDADPASILRGGPDFELSKRFVEFCMSDEAQTLWQLPSARSRAASTHSGAPVLSATGEPLGPSRYELRRLPVRRSIYAHYGDHFIDKANPFDIASRNRNAGWRPAIGPLLGAATIDNADLAREAWGAILAAQRARAPAEALAQMSAYFDAMPVTSDPKGGKPIPFTAARFRAVKAVWKDPARFATLEVEYATFFRDQYRAVLELARTHKVPL